MKNFTLYSDHVTVQYRNGRKKQFFFDSNTGKPFYRFKDRSVGRIRHTGIYLGIDRKGTSYFIHNHIIHGKATIVSRKVFAHGKPVYPITKKTVNPPLVAIELALQQVQEGNSYHVFRNNCQTLTNWSCHNSKHSDDVKKWTGIGSVGLGLLAVATGFLLRSKNKA